MSDSCPTLYGIKNCDSVKKARRWLEAEQIEYQFHDIRSDGLNRDLIQEWIQAVGIDAVVNKRSTTWKQLDTEQQAQALSAQAEAILLEYPTLIKRPILKYQNHIELGFKPELYQQLFL